MLRIIFCFLILSSILLNIQLVYTRMFDSNYLKYRYLDLNGNLIIDPKIKIIGDFSEGLSKVIKDNKLVYINKCGKVVIDLGIDYSNMEGCGNFSEGLTFFESKEMYDFINPKGKVLIEDYGNKIGFINKRGEIVIKPEFYHVNNFHEGLAVVETKKGWCIINRTGKTILEPKNYIICATCCLLKQCRFSEGLFRVILSSKWERDRKSNKLIRIDKWGFINNKGEIAIIGDYNWVDNFSEGFARFKKGLIIYHTGIEEAYGGKYGFINKNGEIVIKAKYKNAKSFSEGLSAVCKKNNNWGYINKKGKMKIKPRFEEAYSFSCGFARVKIDGKFGYIDKSGNYIIQPTFENAKDFSQCYAAVEANGKWGYIGTNGKYFIEPKFLEAHSFSEGFARVKVEVDNNEP